MAHKSKVFPIGRVSNVPMKNDPMVNCHTLHGFGLVASEPENSFTITFEGFPEILNTCYAKIISRNSHFCKMITRSLFHYYGYQHLYARLVVIKMAKGLAMPSEISFARLINEYYPLPTPIAKYLESIGDVVDGCGAFYGIELPYWPNEEGHFGRVSKDTHHMYEAFPAPLVILRRVYEDYLYTNEKNRDPEWQLPEEIACQENGHGKPTANLLGWAPAESLTKDQGGFIASVIQNQMSHKMFQLSMKLINHVSGFLSRCPLECRKMTYHSAYGSICQVPWQQPVNNSGDFYRSFHYVKTCETSVRTFAKTDAHMLAAALLFAFRVKKEPRIDAGGRELHSYACYDFDEFKNVPISWQLTRNKTFEYGAVQRRWNRVNLNSFTTYRNMWSFIDLFTNQYYEDIDNDSD